MTRKLASIQRITSLTPIDGADSIEKARVLGWDVVVGKGDFLVGDLAVFFEIDSFLPAEDLRYASFEPRFTTWDGKRGMRVKSIKLRKQLSQGLLMPISKSPEISAKLGEAADVTEVLKIEKWEVIESIPGVPNRGSIKTFPGFIRKTDQERVQNCMSAVYEHYLKGTKFEVTVKKDGSSMTVYTVRPDSVGYAEAVKLRDGKTKEKTLLQKLHDFYNTYFKGVVDTPKAVQGLASRNMNLSLDGSGTFHTAFEKYDLRAVLGSLGDNKSLAIQGELVAPSIQENYEKVKDVEFHVFDIFDIDAQEYVSPNFVRQICAMHSLPHATVLVANATLDDILLLDREKLLTKDQLLQAILDYAEGPGDNLGVKREGVVFKSHDRSFSFKAISNSYLLKTGK